MVALAVFSVVPLSAVIPVVFDIDVVVCPAGDVVVALFSDPELDVLDEVCCDTVSVGVKPLKGSSVVWLPVVSEDTFPDEVVLSGLTGGVVEKVVLNGLTDVVVPALPSPSVTFVGTTPDVTFSEDCVVTPVTP